MRHRLNNEEYISPEKMTKITKSTITNNQYKGKVMKSKSLALVVTTCISLQMTACDSSSDTTATTPNTPTTKDSTSSNNNNTPTSSCDLASILPTWPGSIAVIWQETLGTGCIATPVTGSVSEIKSYSKTLSDSGWKSKNGWLVTGSISTATYQKNKNADTAYVLSMSGSSANSLYAFNLDTKEIVYNYPLERVFNILPIPAWTATTGVTWTYGSRNNIVFGNTNAITTTATAISAYSSALLKNKWSQLPQTVSGERDYVMSYNNETYIFTIQGPSKTGVYYFIFSTI